MGLLFFIIGLFSFFAILVLGGLWIVAIGKKNEGNKKKFMKLTGLSAGLWLLSTIIFFASLPGSDKEIQKEQVTVASEKVETKAVEKKEPEKKEPKKELTEEEKAEVEAKKKEEEARLKKENEEKAKKDEEERVAKEKVEAEQKAKDALSVSQKNAIRQAEQYINYTAFSKSGLVVQLEYEGYSNADSTFAVENIDVDWTDQAVKHAQQYMDYSAFSRSGLITQLTYEGHTQADAEHAATQVGL